MMTEINYTEDAIKQLTQIGHTHRRNIITTIQNNTARAEQMGTLAFQDSYTIGDTTVAFIKDEGALWVTNITSAGQSVGVSVFNQSAVEAIFIEHKHPITVYCESAGITKAALASAIGKHRSYITNIIAGRNKGTAKTLAAIARVLEVDLDLLTPPQTFAC